ncbi:MAG: EAL domain-containing protein [Pseudomonas sp.]|nr:EAL domain-containing protein [Pseudomonas sp.]|tara:strand:+ start:4364 stop:6127 length:1764 start_codon:yes stop_codon:yes gene_type:complete
MSTPDPFLVDDFPVGCLVSHSKRTIVFSNRFFESRFGYSRQALVGTDLFALLSKASQIMFDSYLMPLLIREGCCEEVRVSLVAASGQEMPVVVSAVRDPLDAERIFWTFGSAVRSEQLFTELTEARKLLQQKVTQLNTLSDTDQLTGLPNRAALSRHLGDKLARDTGDDLAFTLAFLDLDGFKQVNDHYGHHMGDRLLGMVARRMTNNLRSDDLVARFGGDEFVILLSGNADPCRAEDSLNRLLREISEPYEVDAVTLQISASVGVTLYPQAEAVEPDQLIRQADQAMYQAKLAGRNQLCMFCVDNEKYQKDRHSELSAIRAAMAAGQFELYYQPKVNMRTGAVQGVEALLRWNHPEKGLLAPAAFLPVLNRTAAGLDMGRWVIETALGQLQGWLLQGLDLHVSVNIAGEHLQHPDFLNDLKQILAGYPGLPIQRLEFEVLETSTIEDIQHVASVLTTCRMMGIRVSLDDFGTGYSTLGHLRDLAVDVLKIDRSFVKDMLTSAGDLAILRGVIGFAQAFECDVIAEGVETLQQGQLLLELGCEWGQGFFIARPMPAAELPGWVARWIAQEYNDTFGAPVADLIVTQG